MGDEAKTDAPIDAAQTADPKDVKDPAEQNPIAEAIDVFLHKCEDIKSSGTFIAVAEQLRKESYEEFLKELSEGENC